MQSVQLNMNHVLWDRERTPCVSNMWSFSIQVLLSELIVAVQTSESVKRATPSRWTSLLCYYCIKFIHKATMAVPDDHKETLHGHERTVEQRPLPSVVSTRLLTIPDEASSIAKH